MADCLVVLQQAIISISSGQQNLIKTYHNEANTYKITKIALKENLDCFVIPPNPIYHLQVRNNLDS